MLESSQKKMSEKDVGRVGSIGITDMDAETATRMQSGEDTSFKSRLRQYFIEDKTTSLQIRLFNVFIKLLSCVLYCARVVQDSKTLPPFVKPIHHEEGEIRYEYLFWVERNEYLWLAQTIVAIISLCETVVVFYISYQGNTMRLLVNVHFLLELLTSFPFVITLFRSELRYLYVPVFLNCWLAKGSLQAMMNDLNRGSFMNQSALFRQLMLLFSVLICLIFTGMCSIEHLQRAGDRQFDLFTSLYFVMVTFSTVGYGDWYPDTWMSRLCVIILICVALVLLPSQLEALGQTWLERRKCGSDYRGGHTKNDSHVVVTITHLEVEFVRDFLDEFYAHPENKRVHVVLLSPAELDNQTRLLLKIPIYSERVFYVKGSALRDEDLERARVSAAKACFILSARHQNKKIITDEHTVLRSWAVKDFAPHVKQYVQIFRPETKMHIEHAEVLICEDEFKYSLLANNCICPGISTFITLLMHTSKGEEGKKSTEPWHKVYGFYSGNEIYMIKAEDSKFFGDFVGKSFPYVSYHAHRLYGVGLIGVMSDGPGEKIRLNPGITHILQSKDVLYYMALTNEESLFNFQKDLKVQLKKADIASTIANVGTPYLECSMKRPLNRKRFLQRAKATDEVRFINLQETPSRRVSQPSVAVVIEGKTNSSSESEPEDSCNKCDGPCIKRKIRRRHPQVRTYIGTSDTLCHMLQERRPTCCLQLDEKCQHCPYTSAHEYDWKVKPIILAADRTSSGMYNLIIPLRAYYRPVHKLHPIVLLLELQDAKTPNPAFLDAISYFPDIYWMQGKISVLDNLLRAGVSRAEHVVVVRETASLDEEHLADCSTIITVQKIHRMFPRLRMITELTHASNMRFVQFSADNPYSLAQSKFEKKERKRGSHMPFMFRLPFAQGGVFSANMLDRLLYQAIIKPYVVTLTRLLLGIDQTEGSGFLSSVMVTSNDLWIKTYGRLYKNLCASVAGIPLGVFRTKNMDSKTVSQDMEEKQQSTDLALSARERRKEMRDHIVTRMRNLGMPTEENLLYDTDGTETCEKISFVIINPADDLQLEEGDIIYLLCSPVKESEKNKWFNPRRGLRRSDNLQETVLDEVNNDPEWTSTDPMLLP
ncbi:hypothetical protein Q1695_000143 [Nippostrongylus brasiliensis]|nr:hypothetical protein Q1695_000143 [Nippostrongylus brasiliensis]